MAQENRSAVEVVSGLLAALAVRDIEAVLASLNDDVEWVSPRSLPYGGTHAGRDAVASRYFPGFLELVDDDFELAADSIEAAGDSVLVRGRLRGHGRVSGKRFDEPSLGVWTVGGGGVARMEYELDTAALLEALDAQPAGREQVAR